MVADLLPVWGDIPAKDYASIRGQGRGLLLLGRITVKKAGGCSKKALPAIPLAI